jgi:hypothetical protein
MHNHGTAHNSYAQTRHRTTAMHKHGTAHNSYAQTLDCHWIEICYQPKRAYGMRLVPYSLTNSVRT